MHAKFGWEDAGTLEATAEAATATHRDALGSGRAATWRPGDKYDPQMTMAVVKSARALAAAGNHGLRFSHLQYLLNAPQGKEDFGPAVGYF